MDASRTWLRRDLSSGLRDVSLAAQKRRSVSVAVVVENPVYREALARAVRSEGFCVTAAVGDQVAAREHIRAASPAVVLFDLPRYQGLSLTHWCAQAAPSTRTIAFSLDENEREILAWAAAGLTGYVSARGSVGDLADSLERVARGEAVYAPEFVATVLQEAACYSRPASRRPRLTSRELEVVGLIADGLSNKEIATRLGIQLATVKNHVHNILGKLDVRRRTDAVARFKAVGSATLYLAFQLTV